MGSKRENVFSLIAQRHERSPFRHNEEVDSSSLGGWVSIELGYSSPTSEDLIREALRAIGIVPYAKNGKLKLVRPECVTKEETEAYIGDLRLTARSNVGTGVINSVRSDVQMLADGLVESGQFTDRDEAESFVRVKLEKRLAASNDSPVAQLPPATA